MLRIIVVAAVCGCLGLIARDANAHGFAGKRFFPATLSTEDPFVADELSLPTVSQIKTPAGDEHPAARQTGVSADIAKRITSDFGFELGATWKRVAPVGLPAQSGFDNIGVGLKYQAYKSDVHETILSLGVEADVGGTGAARVGAESFSVITPAIFFGKGFGDLPESMSGFKPLAVTAVVGFGAPTRTRLTDDDGAIERIPNTLNVGIAIAYSIPYLQSVVKDIGLTAPFDRVTPIVEISLETPLNRGAKGKTTGTVNPGFLWTGRSVQFGIEAVIPVNGRTGLNVGFVAQIHFYLDDLFPHSLGRPLFGANR